MRVCLQGAVSSPAPVPVPYRSHTVNCNPQTNWYISHLKKLPLEIFHFSIFFVTICYQIYLMPNLTWCPHIIMFMKHFYLSVRQM